MMVTGQDSICQKFALLLFQADNTRMPSFEEIVEQLYDENDWLVRGIAVRRLIDEGDKAASVIGRVFDLTFDENAAVQDVSCVLIKRLGAAAVPYLICETVSACANRRARAIELLTETGLRRPTTTYLRQQRLEERDPCLPEWGCDPKEVLGIFREALKDADLSVRFAAACALEEFGTSIEKTIPVFVDALRSSTQHVQNWAALRLGRIGPAAREACDVPQQKLESPCERTRLAARNAMDSIGCT
jgi:HEAT repeat protein